MSADIFISFASQDAKMASTICAAIEGRGFKCWISSRDILPGENFQSAIVRAIRQAKILLLVFTSNSNRSEEMTKELALASQQKLMVVPLRVEDVAPSDAFAYEFATRQWIDLFADWELAMNQLCARIGAALANDPAPTDTIVMGKSPTGMPVTAALPMPPKVAKTATKAGVAAPKPARRGIGTVGTIAAGVAVIAVTAIAVPFLTDKHQASAGAMTSQPALPQTPSTTRSELVVASATIPPADPVPSPDAAAGNPGNAPVTPDANAPAAVAAPAAAQETPGSTAVASPTVASPTVASPTVASPTVEEAPKPKLAPRKRVAKKPVSNLPY